MAGYDRLRRHASPWAFVAFPLAIVFLFTALPSAVGVGLSFFEWSGGGAPRFVGLENYRALLAQPQFHPALRNTLLLAIITVPATVGLGFLIAAAVNARWFVGRTFVRTVYFLPTIISIVAIGFIWRWVLNPTPAGLLNYTIHAIAPTGWKPMLQSVDWLGNSPVGLGTIMFVSVWRGLGFAVVLYLAALSNVPRSLYDAAAVDGAGRWQTLWLVTWPSVRPMTLFLMITGMIGALQVFDIVLVMIGTHEQPWTDVLNMYLYREFTRNRLGFASTIGVVVLVLTVVITAAQLAWARAYGRDGA